jgi:hypothetical protein
LIATPSGNRQLQAQSFAKNPDPRKAKQLPAQIDSDPRCLCRKSRPSLRGEVVIAIRRRNGRNVRGTDLSHAVVSHGQFWLQDIGTEELGHLAVIALLIEQHTNRASGNLQDKAYQSTPFAFGAMDYCGA